MHEVSRLDASLIEIRGLCVGILHQDRLIISHMTSATTVHNPIIKKGIVMVNHRGRISVDA
mgnify:CR=1 FL=1